ncbi:polyketide synthase [Streptomyces aureocirculatus]|uniref:polyketide synthase n=1 Tax=Streptomyces aureocirculatus TaxID=67275 RepID=UPI00068CCF6A|nr:polyketide synthase [Streptomyces aureocirculatus]
MTTFDPQARRSWPARPGEPIAIVGIAELDPGTLDDVVVDVARFGIPPMQAKSMNRMQLLMLEAARRCLADAGHPDRPLPAERTDVITGLCFALDRQHANALRVELPRYAREVERAASAAGAEPDSAARAAEELRAILTRRLGGSPHDRVGEMASTIPARIAAAFKLRGRTLAVESAEATSFVAVSQAVRQLRAEVSDAALVLAGQRRESPYVARALAAKLRGGSEVGGPERPGGEGPPALPLTEGVGAVLLKRLPDAVRDGDRVYATILDCTLRHDPLPGCFRPSRSTALRRLAAEESLRAAGADADTVQYVEAVESALGPGVDTGHPSLAADRPSADVGHLSVDVSRPSADVDRPSVDVDSPSADVGHPSEDVGHPFADVGHPSVDVSRPSVDVGRPSADVSRPSVDVDSPSADVGHPSADVSRPSADVGHLSVDVDSPSVDVGRPSADVGHPSADVSRSSADVSRSSADVSRSSADVDRPSADVGHPSADVSRPSVNVDNPSVNVGHPSADVSHPSADVGHPVDVDSPSADVGHPSADVDSPSTDVSRPSVDIGHPSVDVGRVLAGAVLGTGDGRAFAHAGLAALAKVASALHDRRYPVPGGAVAVGPGTRTGAPWTAGVRAGVPRRAVVHGASLTGTFCHLVLEEHPGTASGGTASVGRGPAPVPGRTGWLTPGRPRARRTWAAATRAVPIAVVGLGGRFAGADDAAGFWRVVRSGRTRIAPVPDSVLDRELYHSPGALSLTHTYTDRGGHVPVPAEPPEDPAVLPPRYAVLDGAQQLALTVAAELFAPCRTRGRPTGRGIVAVGGTLGPTRERRAHTALALGGLDDTVTGLAALGGLSALQRKKLLERLRERTGATGQDERGDALAPALLDGCLASGVAALLANEYGLEAVPLAVEAACASSLAALDIAVGELRAGTVDYAVAGGVELACTVRDMVLCSALGLLSHGTNAPFDATADGFTPGDGCGLFLLKRYDDARRDGDPIHGLIRAVGASNDAKSLIAPDVDGQVRAMQRAFAQVDFEPCTVDYLEAHGTGTKVGDRVEIAAAARLYAGGPRAEPLRIGSAKSFFGHTFAAAGSAGLLRTLLALRAATLPPNTSLRTLNPALGLAAIPAEILTRPEPWTRPPGRPRRAAVSSFGTGGINYHVLVEEQPDDRHVRDVRDVRDDGDEVQEEEVRPR